MLKAFIQQNLEDRQYYNMANLVYISAIVSYIILIPIFIAITNWIFPLVYVFCMMSALLAYRVNKTRRYGLASLIFITAITFSAVISTWAFGPAAGFYYYFFNLSILIVFSNWHPWVKFLAVSIETLLLITLFIIFHHTTPFFDVSFGVLVFLHTLNALYNTTGVANSANYYLTIVKDNKAGMIQMASTDYLTNLSNRQAFVEYYYDLEKDCQSGIGLIMLDVDNFKHINDTFGHLAGDDVLKTIADLLKTTTKEGLLARYGGEEFIYVFTAEHKEVIDKMAETIRTVLANHSFKHNHERFNITVSVGALYRPKQSSTCDTNLLSKVDRLLYQSKANGKNIVSFEVIQ